MKRHISDLENAYADLEFANMELMANIGTLEEQILDQNKILLKYEGLPKNIPGKVVCFKETTGIKFSLFICII